LSPICTTSPVLAQKLSSPPEVSCAARTRALHDQADTRSSPAKRSTMPGDAEGSSAERHLLTCDSILTRELGAPPTCGNNDVQLQVRARDPSPGQAIMLARQRGRKLPDKARMGFDGGRSFGSSAALRRSQGDWQVACTSTRKSQQTRAYWET
jgi:hypothetical protein